MPGQTVGPPMVTASALSTGPGPPGGPSQMTPPETPPQMMATQVLRLHCEAPPPQVKTPPHSVCPRPQVMRKQVAPQVWSPPPTDTPPQVIWQVTAQVWTPAQWVGPPQVMRQVGAQVWIPAQWVGPPQVNPKQVAPQVWMPAQ